MSESREFFTYTRDQFLEQFVHPDDRAAVEDTREKRALHVRAEYLAEMRTSATPGAGSHKPPPQVPWRSKPSWWMLRPSTVLDAVAAAQPGSQRGRHRPRRGQVRCQWIPSRPR